MKKLLAFAMCLLFLLCCACSDTSAQLTKDYQTVAIPDSGTIKLPQGWSLAKEDGLYCIRNQEGIPVIVESLEENGIYTNKYYGEYTLGDLVSSAVFSNGAVYGQYKVGHAERTKELLFIDVPNYDSLEGRTMFVVWDETITIEWVKSVAETFVPY